MARVTTLVYKATGRKVTTSGTVVTPPATDQTVRPPLMGSGNALYAPDVQSDGLILAPFTDNSQSFYGPIVSAAAVFISPPLLANTPVFFAPTVNQTIYLPQTANEQTFYAPQVLLGQSIVAPLLSNTQTFYGPQLNQTITADLVNNTAVIYAPEIVTGTAILPTLLDNSNSVFGPQLNLKVTPGLLTNTQAFYSPTVASGYIIRPSSFASGQAFYPPQVNLKVISGWANNSNTVYGPVVSSNALIVAPFLNASSTVYAPQINLKVSPPLLTNSNTLYSPAVVLDTSQVVSAPYHLNSQTFYAPRLNMQVRAAKHTNVNGFFGPTVSPAITPGFALSTPVVTLTTAAGEIPEVDITMGADIYAGYYLRIQRSSDGVKNVSDGSYTTASVNIAHMVRAEEVDEDILAISSDNLIADGYVDPVSGVPWVQQYRWEREDGAISGWSNQISGTVTVATTVLYTAAVNVGTFNKKSYLSVTGSPPLVATGTNAVGAPQCVRSTAPKTGKRQFEVTVTTLSDNYICVGLEDGTTDLNSGLPAPGITNANGAGLRINSSGFGIFKAGVSVQSGLTGAATGDVLSAVFDTSAATLSFYRTRSGSTVQIGSTVTGIGLGTWQAYLGSYSGSVLTANFGQSAFTRTLGVGEIAYG